MSDNWVGEYMMGELYGMGSGVGGAAGRLAREQNDRLRRWQRENEEARRQARAQSQLQKQLSTPSTPGGVAIGSSVAIGSPLTAEERPIHDWQKEELGRRKANLMSQPASGISWEHVKAGIRNRYGR